MTTPIFVLGKHRSGTTWVANLLASHLKIFTPEHELHRGQHESAFFSSLVPYCRNGRTAVDRRAIAAIFERSDFWRLLFESGAPLIDIEKYGVAGYFAKAMDTAAKRKDCTHWVEKTPGHTLYLPELLTLYPNAKFVAVKRSRLDVVQSNVYKFRDPDKISDWFAESVSWELYNKIINYFSAEIYVVSYEALSKDYDRECRAIFDYIGVAVPDKIKSRWSANSSFDGPRPTIPARAYCCIRLVQLAFLVTPAKIWSVALHYHRKFKKNKLPNWFFLIYGGAAE